MEIMTANGIDDLQSGGGMIWGRKDCWLFHAPMPSP